MKCEDCGDTVPLSIVYRASVFDRRPALFLGLPEDPKNWTIGFSNIWFCSVCLAKFTVKP